MDVPCLACSEGPSGFDGHADLMMRTIGDARLTLQCRRCFALWSRTLEREGYFAWSALTERMASGPRMGIAVPPRSNAPSSFAAM